MNTEVQVFTSAKFGQLRTAEIDGIIWFCGKDVAEALGYQLARKAIKDHCKEKGVLKWNVPHPQSANKQIEMTYIDEGNMYRLISHSKLPSAERFESWVFDEVLPSIRRTGSYIGKSENPNVALVTITPERDSQHLWQKVRAL